MKYRNNESGQATVELALLIPVFAIFLLLIIQVALVVRGHVLVAHASRGAARELSVNKNSADAIAVAHKSLPDSEVTISRPNVVGQYLAVTVTKEVTSSLPFLGLVFPDVTVSDKTIMRVEK